jgi:putative nucleotidyltransferase with HDIG domain
MSLTVEERDPYTAGHQRRTTDLAVAIAGEMGLSEHQIKGVQMAGFIHDIGKISIPAEILSKPGRLNEAEILLIRRHPQVGYEILKKIDFPWPVDLIVLQHHEKMDGSGYPQGLSGKETLVEARILCVADVVETISSHRPYRPGLGLDKALEDITKNRGILFDPRVVDVCLTLFQNKNFQFE